MEPGRSRASGSLNQQSASSTVPFFRFPCICEPTALAAGLILPTFYRAAARRLRVRLRIITRRCSEGPRQDRDSLDYASGWDGDCSSAQEIATQEITKVHAQGIGGVDERCILSRTVSGMATTL